MKLQKIMLDGGFTCPNRDGRVGRGGCTFCRCESFNPDYCRANPSITAQLEAGKRFFAGKYRGMKYLAYFQAYSSTYATPDELRRRYDEALAVEDVVGLVVATRPDCLDEDIMRLFRSIRQRGYSVTVELGCESFYDRTLLRVNRGHTAARSVEAVNLCRRWDVPVTVHLMLGLPGETEADILAEAEMINSLPVISLKLHQLQILEGTRMHAEWMEKREDFLDFTLDSYAGLVADFIGRLRKDIHVERYASSAPPGILVHPRFGVKPAVVEKLVRARLEKSADAPLSCP